MGRNVPGSFRPTRRGRQEISRSPPLGGSEEGLYGEEWSSSRGRRRGGEGRGDSPQVGPHAHPILDPSSTHSYQSPPPLSHSQSVLLVKTEYEEHETRTKHRKRSDTTQTTARTTTTTPLLPLPSHQRDISHKTIPPTNRPPPPFEDECHGAQDHSF
jgi:hypothetical protein